MQSARRLAAVKAEVGNTTEQVQAEIAEAQQNATDTDVKARASNKIASTLSADAEDEEATARNYILDVQVAADKAKDEMGARLGTIKDDITKKVTAFGQDAARAAKELKENISTSVDSIRPPVQAKVTSTVNLLESNLGTLSTGWDSNLTWLEEELGKLQETVAQYIG